MTNEILTTDTAEGPSAPYVSDMNENRQNQEICNDSSTLSDTNPNTTISFGARTAEQSRILADNISSTIEEIRPFIQHATQQPRLSLTTLWMLGVGNNHAQPNLSLSNSYVINLDEHLSDTTSHNGFTHEHHVHEVANGMVENQNNNNNNNASENNIFNHDQISLETRATLKLLQQYVPFLLILLTKVLYDYKTGILVFIVLLVTFIDANNYLKREIAKQNNRSYLLLLLILCYINGCIWFVAYTLDLYTLTPYAEPLTIWDLLCYVIGMDFFLKLVTIVLKVLLTCVPARLLAFQSRGKYYLMIEATSQLYRCLAPVQPWLYYLFGTYEGLEKIVGIIFSALYTISKGYDLWPRLKLFRTALWKLFQNVSLGVSPTSEQIIASGSICTICHEKYSTPVRLHCKHIFCEICVSTWLDRERSCPLCRASITDDPIYRDGHTTHFIQLY